jgi:thiamine monophosphate kinase
VGAIVEELSLPIEAGARDFFEQRGTDAVAAAVSCGDDYELLFAVRPRLKRRLTAALRHGGVPLTRIGVCTAERAFVLRGVDATDRPLPAGFNHFR